MTNPSDLLDSTAPPPDVPGKLSSRDRTVIGVLLVSTFVVILNETIMAWPCRY